MPRQRIIRNPKPAAIPGLKKQGYKQAGPKTGRSVYVLPKPKAPAAPKPPPGPYDRYKETAPWAIPGLEQIDRDQAAHQSYVSDKVAPWLSGALQGLQGFQDAAQTSYGNTIRGAGVGALNVSAGMTPLSVGPTAPGGIVAGNNQYLTEGGTIRAQGMASSMLAESANAERMNKLAPIPYSQGAIQALADYAKQLPQVYVERRRAYTEKVDQFVAEMQQAQAELAEEMRSNRVREAISAQNAQTNAAIQFGRLGLSAEEIAADQTQATAEANSPVPYGFVRLPNGNIVRDPQVPSASSGGGSGGDKQYGPNQLRKEGFVPLNPKAGPKWKQRAVRATDGSLWIKQGSGSSGRSGSTTKRLNVTELEKDLLDLYKPGDVGGWEDRYDQDPQGAGAAVARWVRENKVSFIKSGRKADLAKIQQVLRSVGGRPAVIALDILTRGYISPDGTWK